MAWILFIGGAIGLAVVFPWLLFVYALLIGYGLLAD
jgi:hypothetical protein